MKHKIVFGIEDDDIVGLHTEVMAEIDKDKSILVQHLPEILFMTSYPPRECGIATYSQDLLKALINKFSDTFSLKVCALEYGKSDYIYPGEVKYTLDTTDSKRYQELLHSINLDKIFNW